MSVRFFKSVRFAGDWELNFVGKVFNLRVGRSQLALWRNYNPIFNILRSS